MCGVWEVETAKEVPRERNMNLKSMQVNISKSVKRMTKRGVEIRAD